MRSSIAWIAASLSCIAGVASGQAAQQAPPRPIAAAIVSPAVIAAFRSGARVIVVPAPNPGPSPLASVIVHWAPFPGASGYRVLRAARQGAALYPPVTPAAALGASVMTDTLTQLPPGWGVVIRVAAVVAGRMVDTTNAVGVTMPAFAPPAMSRGVNAWSMPALSTGFATVWEAGCWSTAPSTVYIGWAKNAAAARYTVQLRALDASAGPVSATPSAPVITSSPGTPLPPKTVFGTSEQFTLPNGYYDVYVRPEFLVYNWPSYGPSADLYVSGAWVYTGIASVPSPVPNLPCSHP